MDHLRRRQSILKTDVEASPTKTFTKNKRISFSGKNSVKEFHVDTDKYTVWGTSYEKEMEATQKAGDSNTSSQIDFSTAMSICDPAPPSAVANKENIALQANDPSTAPRYSFALLAENEGQRHKAEQTILHRLPGENFSHEEQYGHLFQIQSYVGDKNTFEMSDICNSTVAHNDTGMEVSMVWKDLMSQTKEATTLSGNKFREQMGNALNYLPEEQPNHRSTVVRNRETIYDGQMDMSTTKSVIVARTTESNVVVNKQRQTVYYDQSEANMDQSMAAPSAPLNVEAYHPDESNILDAVTRSSRKSIHYTGSTANMDMSRVEDKENVPVVKSKVRETIYTPASMDESLAMPPPPSRSARQTIVYRGDERDALEESIQLEGKVAVEIGLPTHRPVTRSMRNTIHFQDDGDMDESTRNPPIFVATKKNRETINFAQNEANMDESVQLERCKEQQTRMSGQVRGTGQSRQTILFNQNNADLDESVAAMDKRTHPRQTINFAQHEGFMDESVQLPQFQGQPAVNGVDSAVHLTKNRQTIVFNQNEGELDISLGQAGVTRGKFNNNRQTINFAGSDEGAMDESLQLSKIHGQVAVTNAPKAKSRQTIVFNQNNGELDMSMGQERITRVKPRETINFAGSDEGAMDESLQIPLSQQQPRIVATDPQKSVKNRQTTYFNQVTGELDESVAPQRQNRQSVYAGQMDESLVQVRNARQSYLPGQMDQPQERRINRQTINFNAQNGRMEESLACDDAMEVEEGPQRTPGKRAAVHAQDQMVMEESNAGNVKIEVERTMNENPRPVKDRHTVYYQEENAGMDETAVDQERRRRQTVYEHEMDVSLTEMEPAKEVAEEQKNTRQTVYYQQEDCELDVSNAPVERRGTIHFSRNEAGMEESLVNQANNPRSRQTINFNQGDRDGGMDETLQERSAAELGPLQMALRNRMFNKCAGGNRTVQEALERTLMERSRCGGGAEKTLLGNEMEESVQLASVKEQGGGASEEVEEKKARQTIYRPVEMEQSMEVNERRGTFNVAPNDMSRMGFMSIMRNSTAIGDSMMVDLNNSEDSVVLMDSRDRPSRPMSRASRMSVISPVVADETVNDLILKFNMTGQYVNNEEENQAKGEKDGLQNVEGGTEEQVERTMTRFGGSGLGNRTSKIPVPKVTRTPIKVKPQNETRLDLSQVDTVCRDAGPVMPVSAFGGLGAMDVEEMEKEAVEGELKQRLSIPAFVAAETTKRHTMLEMRDLSEEEEEEERELKKKKEKLPGVNRYRQLDLTEIKEIDREEEKQLLMRLRYMVEKLEHVSTVEHSMYLEKTTVEDRSLKESVFREIKEKTDRALLEEDLGIDWGCFPLCLPMEDMIKNLVESEHKRWRYQDLYYYVGLLKFTHRLIKTFQVVIRFDLDDAEFEKEHYLRFIRFQIIEQDLSRWCDVDRRMHRELMRQLPVGLTSLYGSSMELGRFLADVDQICCRIFTEMAV